MSIQNMDEKIPAIGRRSFLKAASIAGAALTAGSAVAIRARREETGNREIDGGRGEDCNFSQA